MTTTMRYIRLGLISTQALYTVQNNVSSNPAAHTGFEDSTSESILTITKDQVVSLYNAGGTFTFTCTVTFSSSNTIRSDTQVIQIFDPGKCMENFDKSPIFVIPIWYHI